MRKKYLFSVLIFLLLFAIAILIIFAESGNDETVNKLTKTLDLNRIWIGINIYILPLIITFVILILYSGFILINYDEWSAKRDYITLKQQLKKEKLIEENLGLIDDLIRNDYDINNLTKKTIL